MNVCKKPELHIRKNCFSKTLFKLVSNTWLASEVCDVVVDVFEVDDGASSRSSKKDLVVENDLV